MNAETGDVFLELVETGLGAPKRCLFLSFLGAIEENRGFIVDVFRRLDTASHYTR